MTIRNFCLIWAKISKIVRFFAFRHKIARWFTVKDISVIISASIISTIEVHDERDEMLD